ncbi:LON peptidase substrate-binding domain-containing protein, partial [Candidatus Woesebacteria bacterium]|nr:LON peptidase substrate-binding domain-containing protein [Candidatus Woesebacteria bacterium]
MTENDNTAQPNSTKKKTPHKPKRASSLMKKYSSAIAGGSKDSGSATSLSRAMQTAQSGAKTGDTGPTILPVIPIREGALFPSTESVLTFGRELSQNAIKQALEHKSLVLLVTQKDPSIEVPKQEDLYEIGTIAAVEKTLNNNESI